MRRSNSRKLASCGQSNSIPITREPSQLLVLRTCSTTKTGWSDDPDGSLPLAERYAEQAIEKNPNEPLARVVAAVAATFNRDLDRAKSQIDVALSLNPNLAMAYNAFLAAFAATRDSRWRRFQRSSAPCVWILLLITNIFERRVHGEEMANAVAIQRTMLPPAAALLNCGDAFDQTLPRPSTRPSLKEGL